MWWEIKSNKLQYFTDLWWWQLSKKKKYINIMTSLHKPNFFSHTHNTIDYLCLFVMYMVVHMWCQTQLFTMQSKKEEEEEEESIKRKLYFSFVFRTTCFRHCFFFSFSFSVPLMQSKWHQTHVQFVFFFVRLTFACINNVASPLMIMNLTYTMVCVYAANEYYVLCINKPYRLL